MLTRRQARLLGLTGASEHGDAHHPSTKALTSSPAAHTTATGMAAPGGRSGGTRRSSRFTVLANTIAVIAHWAGEGNTAGAFHRPPPPVPRQVVLSSGSVHSALGHSDLHHRTSIRSAAPVVRVEDSVVDVRPPEKWEQSERTRPQRLRVSLAGTRALTSSSSFPPSRVPAAQLKSAWRSVVRDVTSTAARSRPSTALTGSPRALSLVRSPEVPGKSDSSSALQRVQGRQRFIDQLQSQLSEGVFRLTYLRAHEERMELLLQRTSHSADEGDFDESAYMKSLDPARSSGEARILSIISSIDVQFSAQFKSVQSLSGSRACHQDAHSSAAAVAERLVSVDAGIRAATRLVQSFNSMLMPYQQEGVRWLLQLNFMEHMSGILADDMGLGKTAQTILYLACYKAMLERIIEEPLQRLLRVVRAVGVGGGGPHMSAAVDRALEGLPFPLHTPITAGPRSQAMEAIRVLKALKLWTRQLTEDDAAEVVASAPSPRKVKSEKAPPLPPIKRRRGRPSRTDMLAARAAPSQSISDSVAEGSDYGDDSQGPLPFDHPGCSPQMNSALETAAGLLPVLIIAPLSTLPHWRAEFEHFAVASLFTVYLINGPRAEREERIHAFLRHCDRVAPGSNRSPAVGGRHGDHRYQRVGTSKKDVGDDNNDGDGLEGVSGSAIDFGPTPVLIIPHDLLSRQLLGVQRRIPNVKWQLIVMDEAQRIKNAQGSLFSKVCRLRSVSRLVLTGTPLQNNVTELFSLLHFLAPQSFHTRQQGDLLEQLDEALMEASASRTLEDRELHVLLCRRMHRLLAPYILRRDKSILRGMLPAKKDFTVVCPLLPFQKARIDELTEKSRSGSLSGNLSVQVRKVLLHPYTALPYFYVDEDVVITSGKLLVLDFMMKFLWRTNHKFLVFCSWTLVLDVVETLCGMRGLPYVRLDGRTSVEQRETNIRLFNTGTNDIDEGPTGAGQQQTQRLNGEAPCCFLISKAAGGVGLNLQSADTVFLLDVDYNPQRDNQALSRVYRVGQTREVRILRLIIDHEVERGVMAIHQAKENLDQAVVQAGKYDLHSFAWERDAELHRVFARTTAAEPTLTALEIPSGGDGPPSSVPPDAGETAAEATSSNTSTSSPLLEASPGSPLFPFGPGPEEDSAESPLSDGQQGRTARRKRARRITFVIDDEEGDGEVRAGPSSPTFQTISSALRAQQRQRVEAEAPSPASYILAMRDRLRQVLLRGHGEDAVLDAMFAEQERRLTQ